MINLKTFQNNGKYLMLALDHRGSFRKYINSTNPEAVTDQEIIQTKGMIIQSMQDQFSGVLLDMEWGLPGYKNRNKPYLLPLEKSGYTDKAGDRVTELGYTAAGIKEMGASGAKLLLYFNPESKTCDQQIATAAKALADAHENDLPFFLEIVTYGNEELGKSRAQWVLRSLEMLLQKDVVPDVWKLEYPGDLSSCEEITKLVGKTPWILLTRGEKFVVFENQLAEAVVSGAVGFLAGRALWQEISDYKTDSEKKEFLNTIVADRFGTISEICLS
ncbi:MAG: tagatose 1,6-diphosphate aldolase [Parcubacteria group bacterium Gr01-1014_13]|nr:MAG: tagatose 1,6-diphosphate aldolase [Parcubacteria group bacterium Gr01-1014_13]